MFALRSTSAPISLVGEAAGEPPSWVAAMLGHASPEMLCSVYARFMRACARRKSIKPGARVGKHGAEGGTRTPTGCPTRPSNVRVCQFRHFGPGTVAKYTLDSMTSAK